METRVPLPEVEVDVPLALPMEQRNLLEMHSIANIMSVIVTELHLLQRDLGGAPAMEALIDRACDLTHGLKRTEDRADTLRGMVALEEQIRGVSDAAVAARPALGGTTGLRGSLDNLASVFSVLRLRVDEILERMAGGDGWRDHDVGGLVENVRGFLAAVERNARGRYRIVTDPAEHDAGSYLVSLEVSGAGGPVVHMPPVVQDVFRDLVANARKYTKPGGTIRAQLRDDGASVHVVVEDDGRGIPQDQLTTVVAFGSRARNVQPHETNGDGYGLTKVYDVVRRWGGRMWIASAEGRGVRVTLRIPRPGPLTAV